MGLRSSSVRFLDNFSAGTCCVSKMDPILSIRLRYELTMTLQMSGTRGATSAEYFLKAGYAVIFMHRQFSLQPFSRHYSHSTNPFLDFLEIDPPINQRLSAEMIISSPPHI